MDAINYFDEIYNFHYNHKDKTIFEINGHKYPYLRIECNIVEDLTDESEEEIKIIIEENKKKLMSMLNDKLDEYLHREK